MPCELTFGRERFVAQRGRFLRKPQAVGFVCHEVGKEAERPREGDLGGRFRGGAEGRVVATTSITLGVGWVIQKVGKRRGV